MNTESETEPEFDPFENEKPARRRGGTAVAWLALLLALLAVGYNGWQWWLARGESENDAQYQAAISGLQSSQSALERQLTRLKERADALEQSGIESDLDALEARIRSNSSASGAHLQRIESLEQADGARAERLASMENALAVLAVRGESPARRMEMAEVDYLLRTANERLQLFGDQRSARTALHLADEQLRIIDDPLYTPVRQQIAAVSQQLVSLPVIDTVTLNAQFNQLQSRIPTLPLQGEWRSPLSESDTAPGDESGQDASLWQRFKSSMADLVTVQRRSDDQALVSIEDQAYVRQGLWLQLESARLAVMRRDGEAYSQALERAQAALDQFFEPGAEAVLSAQDAINDLLRVPLQLELPDISAPWAELRRLNQVRAPLPSAEPEQPPALETAPPLPDVSDETLPVTPPAADVIDEAIIPEETGGS